MPAWSDARVLFCQLESFVIESSSHFWLIILELLSPIFLGRDLSLRMASAPACSWGTKAVFSDFVMTPWHTCHSRCQSPQRPWTVKELCPYISLTFTCKHKELQLVWSALAEGATKNCDIFFCPGLILICSRGHRNHHLTDSDQNKNRRDVVDSPLW